MNQPKECPKCGYDGYMYRDPDNERLFICSECDHEWEVGE